MEPDTNTTREVIESIETLKADVLGTVSHELRGPLTAIKGYAMTLLRHERHLAREERRQYLQAINEASDRLEVIIERLLEVSQLETEQITLQLSPVDMASLAREAIAALEERVASEAPARFTFHLRLKDVTGIPTRSVPFIRGDPRRLREVLDNLLDNAIQYSPQGGSVSILIQPVGQTQPVVKDMPGTNVETGKIVDADAAYASQDMLEISVCDEGQGIPAGHLERIFGRFHRVDTSLIREANGLGLGLAICKYITRLHHGIIWAENKPGGKGSVFRLRLPLSDAPF